MIEDVLIWNGRMTQPRPATRDDPSPDPSITETGAVLAHRRAIAARFMRESSSEHVPRQTSEGGRNVRPPLV
jgi:hypothetical protein